MNPINLKIKDLITPDAKLTFLVGAGSSMDPPSCLPTGEKMMKAIIEYTCAESEIEKILELDDLRFEQLVEIVRDRLDTELKIIDYYGQCKIPNKQHFFLAEMIKNGHFVLTTNFDFLIEYALQETGVSKEQIVPVITRDDFEKFQDPYELFEQGKKAIYKVHGSTKNIITKEDTKKSLVATIQAFGANKEGENVFQLESFKQPAFIYLTKNRSLVVMGYSGSDDFDIVPTLKILNIPSIIWINHSKDIEIGNEVMQEIDVNASQALDELDKKLMQMKNADHVYRVDVNTTGMVKQLLKFEPKLSSKDFAIKSSDWLKNKLEVPSKIIKYYIPYRIYDDFDMYDDAFRCSEKILQLAEKLKDKFWEATALNNIASIHYAQGNYPEALRRYEEALQIDEQLGDLSGKATRLNNIGMIHGAQGNYPEALKRYEEALQIFEQLGDLRGKATLLNNIGEIYRSQGNYPEALKRYEEALQIDEQLGDLSGKVNLLNNIGLIYEAQGNYPEALKRYEEALQIDEQLGDLSGKATRLNDIGEIFRAQGNYPEALKRYEEALQIFEQLGNLRGKSSTLNNIGLIFRAQGNYPEALKRFEEALQINEQLERLPEKATYINNIASIHYAQGNYPEVLKRFEEALQIDEQLGDLSGKATRLNNIGMIYKAQGNYPEAMKRYEEALQIDEQLGDLSRKAIRLINIASIHYAQGNYPKALKRYEEALQIAEQLGELPRIALCYWWIGMIYGKLNDTSKAFNNLDRALNIYEQLGLENYRNSVLKAISDLKS